MNIEHMPVVTSGHTLSQFFEVVFSGCLEVLNVPLTFDLGNGDVWTFSLWQVGCFCWMFILAFNFICRLFGHEPIDQAEHEAEWYDQTGGKENKINYENYRWRRYHY